MNVYFTYLFIYFKIFASFKFSLYLCISLCILFYHIFINLYIYLYIYFTFYGSIKCDDCLATMHHAGATDSFRSQHGSPTMYLDKFLTIVTLL